MSLLRTSTVTSPSCIIQDRSQTVSQFSLCWKERKKITSTCFGGKDWLRLCYIWGVRWSLVKWQTCAVLCTVMASAVPCDEFTSTKHHFYESGGCFIIILRGGILQPERLHLLQTAHTGARREVMMRMETAILLFTRRCSTSTQWESCFFFFFFFNQVAQLDSR